jgi:hypothetical protein
MAIFDPKSRYVLYATAYHATDRRGRTVSALTAARPANQRLLGEHERKGNPRLDHLANHYLGDACGYWRLCEINEVIVPDAIAQTPIVRIPVKS